MNNADRKDNKDNSEQAALWNGNGGRGWVEAQVILDQMFQPMEDLLVNALPKDKTILNVLDVGCGTGSTTLAIARKLGKDSQCIGVDISAPMIELARSRAGEEISGATFIVDDAESHVFEAKTFDRVVSRFGVMFFNDAVRAFTNLRCACRNGATLHFLAWRGGADNPFMSLGEKTAAPLLTNLPAREPGKPGQFAFGDFTKVQNILMESGWKSIEITPVDMECAFPEAGLIKYLTLLGPLGRALQEIDEERARDIMKIVRQAFEPYVYGNQIRFTAACWNVIAKA